MTHLWIRHRGLLAREALLSALINVVLSSAIAWVRFGHQSQVPIWGTSGLLLDGVPSTALPVILMTVALTLVTRQRINRTVTELPQGRLWLPDNLALRAIALALGATLVVLLISYVAFQVSGVQSISVTGAMSIKIIQAVLVGAAFGPVIVLRCLYEHSHMK